MNNYKEPAYEIVDMHEKKDIIKTSGLSLKPANYNTEAANWNEQWNAMLNIETEQGEE